MSAHPVLSVSKESTKWRQTSLLYESGISWSTGGRAVDSSDTQVYVLMCACCFWKGGKKQENCDHYYRGGSYAEIPKRYFSASVYSREYTEEEKHCAESFTFPFVVSWASSCQV